MKQQQEFKKAREALLEKVAARSFAKNYLSSLKSDVSNQLPLALGEHCAILAVCVLFKGTSARNTACKRRHANLRKILACLVYVA